MNSNELKELYLRLKEKEVNLDLLGEADIFRNEAKKSNNDEYYLRGTCLILDIFTASDNLIDDALRLALDSYELARSYSDKYPDIYKELLSKLSYIYITKQLYTQALSIENELKDYIDPDDLDEVNRWQLELAYIHNAIDEKAEALRKFQAILLNKPDNNLKSVCLSNIAQLYIESHDFVSAKKTLEENYKLAREINDEEGIRYINCLKGKIYRLEGNYKDSYNTLYPLIKDINEINIENFNYLNEFINLLIDMGKYSKGLEFAEAYFKSVDSSIDLQDKLTFFKNILKMDVLNAPRRNFVFDYTKLFKDIEDLEREIQKNKEINANKMREAELDLDALNKERFITNKIKDNLLKVSTPLSSSLREFFMDFGRSLTEVVPMDEVIVILFDKSLNQDFQIIPLKEELVSTYQFISSRLYERKLNYSDLDKTVFLEVLSNNDKTSLDFVKNSYAYVNPFSHDFYVNEKVKYITGYPLKKDDALFGEVIFLSKSNNILDHYYSALLDIIVNVFQSNLMNMLLLENNKLEQSLYKEITSVLDFGIFYYSDINKTYLLSDALKELLHLDVSEISADSFHDLILKSDYNKYMKKYALMAEEKDYDITYHLVCDDNELLVQERGHAKVINNNLYYVGTISKISLDKDVMKELNKEILNLSDLSQELERRKKDKFVVLAINNAQDVAYYDKLKQSFKEQVYFNNNVYYVLFNEKLKDVLTITKLNKVLLKYNYTLIEYPQVLVRLEDLTSVSEYVLDTATSLYTVFTNEIYAQFISVNTINQMINRAIIDDKVELMTQTVTIDNQFVGFFISPNIPGVFGNNLKVASLDTIKNLDRMIVKKIAFDENISIYPISLTSLKEIVDSNIIQNKSRIAFKVTNDGNLQMINEIISKLRDTKCRLIIDYNLFKEISTFNMITNSDIILAFSEDLNEEEKEVVLKFMDNYYIFDSLSGLKVSKVVNKK